MSDVSPPRMPSFLGIGAARSGTTWLHENLRHHPQVWVPPAKELHYFDLLRHGPIYFNLPGWTPEGWSRGVQAIQRRQVRHALLRFRISPRWAWRFLFGKRNDEWYKSLFRKGRVSGEITPGYMTLPREVIEEIKRFNPDMKLIFLMRDPVSRTWSAVRREIARPAARLKGAALEAGKKKVLELMCSPKFVAFNDYITALNNWRSVFDEKQIFIGFYDHLRSRPRELLRSIHEFLGVEPIDNTAPAALDEVVNAAPALEMPEEFLPRLYSLYVDQLRELEKMFGDPVSKWRAKAEEYAAKLAVPAA